MFGYACVLRYASSRVSNVYTTESIGNVSGGTRARGLRSMAQPDVFTALQADSEQRALDLELDFARSQKYATRQQGKHMFGK